jgi:hypothetical protein
MWIDQHPSAFEWLDVTGNILFVKTQYRCLNGLGSPLQGAEVGLPTPMYNQQPSVFSALIFINRPVIFRKTGRP